MSAKMTAKDPDAVEPYFVVWCSKSGTNANTAADTGELKGATIATSTWVVPTGITKDSDDTGAITIAGISYGVDTVATVWLSGGEAGEEYTLTNRITTSDGRTLDQSIVVPVKEL